MEKQPIVLNDKIQNIREVIKNNEFNGARPRLAAKPIQVPCATTNGRYLPLSVPAAPENGRLLP